MKKMEVECGDVINNACERLASMAPAFMIFNDTRVEAQPGDTAAKLYDDWYAARTKAQAEYEASDEYKKRQAENERTRQTEQIVRDFALNRIEASGVRTKYPWTSEMGEVSGFGGGYEAACRDMIYSGLAVLEANSDPGPRSLDKALSDACPDCSGAMHGAALNACKFIQANSWPNANQFSLAIGWSKYVAAMTKRSSEGK